MTETAVAEARLFVSRIEGTPASYRVSVFAGPYVGPEDARLRRTEFEGDSAQEALEQGLRWIGEVLMKPTAGSVEQRE